MRTKNSRKSWLIHIAAGYAVLLGISTRLPLGLHRVVMRHPGWWIFPSLFALGMVGAAGFMLASHSPLWSLLVAPYLLMLIGDTLTLWLWAWPFEWTPADKLCSLNARFGIYLHLTMGLLLAVVFWLGVHHG